MSKGQSMTLNDLHKRTRYNYFNDMALKPMKQIFGQNMVQRLSQKKNQDK